MIGQPKKPHAIAVSFVTLAVVAVLVTAAVGYTARKAQRSANDANAAATYVRGLVKTVADLANVNRQAIIRINQGNARSVQLADVAKSICDQVNKTQLITNRQIRQRRALLEALLADRIGPKTASAIRAQLPTLHPVGQVDCGQILNVAQKKGA